MSENWARYYEAEAEKCDRIAEKHPNAGKHYTRLAEHYRAKARSERESQDGQL